MNEAGPEKFDDRNFSAGQMLFDAEGMFARDADGQLIRAEKADQEDLQKVIRLKLDGRDVEIKSAVPLTDSQGNPIRDANGLIKPRFTTIYDAILQEFVKKPGDPNPVPTLCHQEHLPPIGVCRVCVVMAAEDSPRGRREQLVPACVQRVSAGMEVTTLESAENPQAAAKVRNAVTTIVDLLAVDHLPRDESDQRFQSARETGPGNELAVLAERLQLSSSRFAPFAKRVDKPRDLSGKIIDVDHSQCILCGRCGRGCNWLKKNNIIGRSGKGYAAIVSFDFGSSESMSEMGSSACVSCGECALSCPTGALEFKETFITKQRELVRDDRAQDQRLEQDSFAFISPAELKQFELFSQIPYKFLQFNASAVVRRKLKTGDVLCREGEYGATAFILLQGRFRVLINAKAGTVAKASTKGWKKWLGGLQTFVTHAQASKSVATLADMGCATLAEGEEIERGPEDIIIGEMSCMNRYPRSATVIAKEEAEVLEIRQNVLYMLQRNSASRKILNRVYRERARDKLRNLSVFEKLDDAAREKAAAFLESESEIILVEPKQTIIAEGDPSQNFFLTRLGFVKFTQAYGNSSRVLNYLGPGTHFGEIGLLSKLGLIDDSKWRGRARATCTALDHVELIRISSDAFQKLIRDFPEVRDELLSYAKGLLRQDAKHASELRSEMEDVIEQGLYGANNLLVLDLERCTRCDECTKACSDTHDGITRLIREGMRFDRFLVASACRSCMDPYCLVGCPVDAIHREGSTLQIQIENHCIGCGLCAQNCPYGNINMHHSFHPSTKEEESKATTCDLCMSIDGRPSCVYACPHDAAFRLTGEELKSMVERSDSGSAQ